jgi:signal peptidase II
MKRKYIALFIVGLLVLDQIVKIVIKTNFALGDEIRVFGDWFRIYFIENPGAAFGMSLGGDHGKLILSLFRIVAVAAIGWYINLLYKKKAPTGVLVGMAMILAGAMGNIIDSAFYGLIFDTGMVLNPEIGDYVKYAGVSEFSWGGYATFLHGCVVDMLYFPLFTINNMPSWLGWLTGGDGNFTFFSPVFNIADSYITIAVIYLLLFQWKYFK